MVAFFLRLFLRMKNCFNSAPVAQQEEQIRDADGAIIVQIRRAVSFWRTRSPTPKKNEQVLHAHASVAVKITRKASCPASLKPISRPSSPPETAVKKESMNTRNTVRTSPGATSS